MKAASTRARHQSALAQLGTEYQTFTPGVAFGANAMPMHCGLDGLVTPVTADGVELIVKTCHEGALSPHDIAGAIEGARLAGEQGSGPSFVAALPGTGSFVCERLGDHWRQARVGDVLKPDVLVRLVALLKAWHGNAQVVSSSIPAGAMFRVARDILAEVPDFRLPPALQMEVAQIAEWVETLVAPLEEAKRPQVLLHGEVMLSNVMLSDTGSLRLVDFDRVTMGDPYRDLAALALEVTACDAERAQLVSFYEGREAQASEVARLTLYALLEDVSWGFWALAGEYDANRRGPELYKYASNRLMRFRLHLGQVDIAKLLREV